MMVNGKKVVMPDGYKRRKPKVKKVRRRAIAHSAGYNEQMIWLRGR